MEIIHIDNVHIPFDTKWNQIAISVSGGADSALLSFLISDFITKNNLDIKIHFISHIRCWKNKPWQQNDVSQVKKYIIKKFSNLQFREHTNFIAPELEYGNIGPSLIDEYGKNVSGDNIQIRSYSEFICHYFNIDAYYNGVTRNPRNVEFKGMPTRDIDSNNENNHLRLMKHLDKWAVHPFRFIEKNWIYKQYKNLNILDLWNLTRSCEGEFKDLNYKNYVSGQKVPICNECFWCKEREWAIEQNK